MIAKRDKFCCGNKIEIDALEYYQQQIDELRNKISKEERAQKKWNAGIAIIVF